VTLYTNIPSSLSIIRGIVSAELQASGPGTSRSTIGLILDVAAIAEAEENDGIQSSPGIAPCSDSVWIAALSQCVVLRTYVSPSTRYLFRLSDEQVACESDDMLVNDRQH
jgi:hypothetical protein